MPARKASVNKNAVTRTTGTPLVKKGAHQGSTHEPGYCLLVGIPAFAGQQLLSRDVRVSFNAREVAAGQWNFPDPALCRRHERLLVIYAGARSVRNTTEGTRVDEREMNTLEPASCAISLPQLIGSTTGFVSGSFLVLAKAG
jgi:hypothetical protein